jgi:putative ABC transport system permease protein
MKNDVLFYLYPTSAGFAENFNTPVTAEEDLNVLRALPGIVDAIQINAVPNSDSGWSMGLKTQPGVEHDGVGTAVYMVDEHGLNALDVEITAGENFAQTDIGMRVIGQVK